MIQTRRAGERGHANHGWLDAWHSFSFADYHDPQQMGFSVLRVLNQDRIQPGKGFGSHPHRDMEIVTWVLEGALEHKDSLGSGSVIRPGDAQLMSAGSGIVHSESNASREHPLELLQMWVLPARSGGRPSYQERHFTREERQGRLLRLVAPRGASGKDVGAALTIGQDVTLYAGSFASGEQAELVLASGRCAWLHVARGAITVNGIAFGPGDGAGIDGERSLAIEGREDSELVLFDLPKP